MCYEETDLPLLAWFAAISMAEITKLLMVAGFSTSTCPCGSLLSSKQRTVVEVRQAENPHAGNV